MSSVRAGTYRGSDRLICGCVLGPGYSAGHTAVTQGALSECWVPAVEWVVDLLGTKEVLSKGRLRVMEQKQLGGDGPTELVPLCVGQCPHIHLSGHQQFPLGAQTPQTKPGGLSWHLSVY